MGVPLLMGFVASALLADPFLSVAEHYNPNLWELSFHDKVCFDLDFSLGGGVGEIFNWEYCMLGLPSSWTCTNFNNRCCASVAAYPAQLACGCLLLLQPCSCTARGCMSSPGLKRGSDPRSAAWSRPSCQTASQPTVLPRRIRGESESSAVSDAIGFLQGLVCRASMQLCRCRLLKRCLLVRDEGPEIGS